jgi:hypothetical protein
VVSAVVAFVLVRDETLVVVLEVDAAKVATNVISDVAAERRGLGHETRGWAVCRGAVS